MTAWLVALSKQQKDWQIIIAWPEYIYGRFMRLLDASKRKFKGYEVFTGSWQQRARLLARQGAKNHQITAVYWFTPQNDHSLLVHTYPYPWTRLRPKEGFELVKSNKVFKTMINHTLPFKYYFLVNSILLLYTTTLTRFSRSPCCRYGKIFVVKSSSWRWDDAGQNSNILDSRASWWLHLII